MISPGSAPDSLRTVIIRERPGYMSKRAERAYVTRDLHHLGLTPDIVFHQDELNMIDVLIRAKMGEYEKAFILNPPNDIKPFRGEGPAEYAKLGLGPNCAWDASSHELLRWVENTSDVVVFTRRPESCLKGLKRAIEHGQSSLPEGSIEFILDETPVKPH